MLKPNIEIKSEPFKVKTSIKPILDIDDELNGNADEKEKGKVPFCFDVPPSPISAAIK